MSALSELLSFSFVFSAIGLVASLFIEHSEIGCLEWHYAFGNFTLFVSVPYKGLNPLTIRFLAKLAAPELSD